MPSPDWRALWTSLPVASSSGSTNETTTSRVLSPSTSPRTPLQNPSRIQANVAANGEIGIIFFHSGQPPLPPLNPLSRIDGRVELSLLPCRFYRRRADPRVTVAIQASSANGRPRRTNSISVREVNLLLTPVGISIKVLDLV